MKNLDRDVELPERDAAKDLAAEVHDNVVGAVYRKLMEIESPARGLQVAARLSQSLVCRFPEGEPLPVTSQA